MNKTKVLRKIAAVLLILTALAGCAGANVTPQSSQETGQKVADDNQTFKAANDHLTVVIDKVERGDSIPEEVSPNANIKKRSIEGYDIVCIYLTIPRIEDIYLFHPVSYAKDDNTFLLDTNGNRHEIDVYTVHGAVATDPKDITKPIITKEGATGILVFTLPVDEKPARLSLVYSFNEVCEQQSAKRGQLDISL